MKKLINVLRYYIAMQKLKYAIRIADKAYTNTRKRYFIISADDRKKKLLVINRSMFRKYKHYGMIDNRAMITNMKQESFYFTPCCDGSEKLSEINLQAKREMYVKWYFNKH